MGKGHGSPAFCVCSPRHRGGVRFAGIAAGVGVHGVRGVRGVRSVRAALCVPPRPVVPRAGVRLVEPPPDYGAVSKRPPLEPC